jgi:hypothetical protein
VCDRFVDGPVKKYAVPVMNDLIASSLSYRVASPTRARSTQPLGCFND